MSLVMVTAIACPAPIVAARRALVSFAGSHLVTEESIDVTVDT